MSLTLRGQVKGSKCSAVKFRDAEISVCKVYGDKRSTDSLDVSCRDISHRDVCFLSSIMGLNVTSPVRLRAPVAQLLKMIHRPCCEQCHVGTVLFLQ